ncbi:unnamed protein product [Choristocarpus tenellus]
MSFYPGLHSLPGIISMSSHSYLSVCLKIALMFTQICLSDLCPCSLFFIFCDGLCDGLCHHWVVLDARPPPGPHPRAYTHQPIWRSHLKDCDILMEGVGEIDARLRTVGMWVDRAEDIDFEEEDGVTFPVKGPTYQRGIVYYLRGDKVAGILLYNTPDLLERAREVLRVQPKITSMKQLKRQIPLAPDDWLRLEETPGSIQFGNEVLTPPF